MKVIDLSLSGMKHKKGVHMRYAYEIYLDGKLVSESNYEYESRSEAESEAGFAVSTYADCYDRGWYEFKTVIRGC